MSRFLFLVFCVALAACQKETSKINGVSQEASSVKVTMITESAPTETFQDIIQKVKLSCHTDFCESSLAVLITELQDGQTSTCNGVMIDAQTLLTSSRCTQTEICQDKTYIFLRDPRSGATEKFRCGSVDYISNNKKIDLLKIKLSSPVTWPIESTKHRDDLFMATYLKKSHYDFIFSEKNCEKRFGNFLGNDLSIDQNSPMIKIEGCDIQAEQIGSVLFEHSRPVGIMNHILDLNKISIHGKALEGSETFATNLNCFNHFPAMKESKDCLGQLMENDDSLVEKNMKSNQVISNLIPKDYQLKKMHLNFVNVETKIFLKSEISDSTLNYGKMITVQVPVNLEESDFSHQTHDTYLPSNNAAFIENVSICLYSLGVDEQRHIYSANKEQCYLTNLKGHWDPQKKGPVYELLYDRFGLKRKLSI